MIVASRPSQIDTIAVAVRGDSAPDQVFETADRLCDKLDDGEGVLILTDLYGSTPSNIANRLVDTHNVSVISGVNLPDFDPLVDITSPADDLKLDVKMPQTLHAAVHHQWNDKLALLGSVGWEEFSEFGKVQVGVTNTGGISTTVDADFRDVWHFGAGAEYQYRPKWELTGGFSLDTPMSTDRTRPIVIPLGSMYRYAIGVEHQKREDLTLGGGLSFIWEGNLPVKDTGGVSGKYQNVSTPI